MKGIKSITVLVAWLCVVIPGVAVSGDLEPSAPPAPTMKTLDEIFAAGQSGGGSNLQFLGTTNAVSPDIGVIGLNRACHLDFGQGSRMCTSVEVMNSSTLPMQAAWQTAKGWTRPVFENTFGGVGTLTVLEASGLDRLAGMSISTTNRGDRKPLATLTGKVIDQTALNGVLDTLYSIHLPILSVERIDDVD